MLLARLRTLKSRQNIKRCSKPTGLYSKDAFLKKSFHFSDFFFNGFFILISETALLRCVPSNPRKTVYLIILCCLTNPNTNKRLNDALKKGRNFFFSHHPITQKSCSIFKPKTAHVFLLLSLPLCFSQISLALLLLAIIPAFACKEREHGK